MATASHTKQGGSRTALQIAPSAGRPGRADDLRQEAAQFGVVAVAQAGRARRAVELVGDGTGRQRGARLRAERQREADILAHQVEPEADRQRRGREEGGRGPGERAGRPGTGRDHLHQQREVGTRQRAERQRLADEHVVRPGEILVAELKDLAHADRPDVIDVLAHRLEDRAAGSEGGGVATDHDRQRRILRPATPPPLTGASSIATPRAAARSPIRRIQPRRGGAQFDQRATGAQRLQRALRPEQHGLDLGVGGQAGQQHVARRRHRDRVAQAGAALAGERRRCGVATGAEGEGKSARSRLRAIGSPIAPTPMKPTRGISALISPSFALADCPGEGPGCGGIVASAWLGDGSFAALRMTGARHCFSLSS
ncbi:MAG: hypothetical protein U0841_08510 [Chloroflexia bacterium]